MSYVKTLSSVARASIRMIWPEPCLACGRDIGGGCGEEVGRPALGLCSACVRKLQAAPEGACPGCGVVQGESEELGPGSSGPASRRCTSCRATPPTWRHLTWAWLYGPPLDAVVLGLKFRRLDYLSRPLAQELARRLSPRKDEIDLVVPVPLHPWRRLGRGYDQAELIAAELAWVLGHPLVPALKRRRRTRAQSHRGRAERHVNLRGAFRARRRLEGERVLLVDDVMTTGATLEAASAALIEAGASVIDVATVARTPGREETRGEDMTPRS